MTNKHKTDWKAVVARITGVFVILAGILLAAALCTASEPPANSIPSIFEPRSMPADSIDSLDFLIAYLVLQRSRLTMETECYTIHCSQHEPAGYT